MVTNFSDFLGNFVLVFFGMALILFGFFYFERRTDIIRNGVRTKAKIIDYTVLSSGEYAYLFMYYVNHKRYVAPLLIGTVSTMNRWSRRRIGKYYEIIYKRDSPDKFIEAHNYVMTGAVCFCIFMGLFLIVLAFRDF